MDSVVAEKETLQRVDLLDRQEFINQLHDIVGVLAKNKKNMCYSINGQWGVGKSYVLDMFEEQAQQIGQEGTVLDKYIIFRYNCWEYDYYEEPLIAIVASIIEQYDEKITLLGEQGKAAVDEIIKKTFVHIGKKLLSIGSEKLKGLTGIEIDPDKAIQFVKETADIAKSVQGKIEDNHSYDALFEFKEVLCLLRANLTKLTQDHTVIIIVDELDRCLPEYTIRVLERLHHLFNGIPNTQIIISTDREQLEHTIQQIYGGKTDAKKYLEKFIAFELNLSYGSLNEEANSYFAFYYDRFEDQKCLVKSIDLDEFKSVILDGIDTRSRIAIIEKCNLLHGILNKDDVKSDFVFNAIEMFLSVLKYHNLDPKKAKDNFSIGSLFEGVLTSKDQKDKQESYTLPGLAAIRKKIEGTNYGNDSDFLGTHYMHPLRNDRILVSCEDLWGILLATYRAILGFAGDSWHYNGVNDPDIKQYALDYWKLLKTIS